MKIAPVLVLGRRFSGFVAIQKDHVLLTDDLYRVIRNPSYLGLMIMLAGWALAFHSLCGLVLAALFVPPLIARIHSEEALLAQHFGAEYKTYRARTWRLIPVRILMRTDRARSKKLGRRLPVSAKNFRPGRRLAGTRRVRTRRSTLDLEPLGLDSFLHSRF